MPSNAIIDLITALWLGFIGACIGSFLNVVAYRMPLGMSVIWKPSHCPKCNHAIRAYDNVPVFGWLWLKGKCRDCSEPISPRYAIVEFVMGLAFFTLAFVELFSGGANLPGGPLSEFTGAVDNFLAPHWPLIGVYAYHGVLLSLLMSVVLMDRDEQQVPRKFVVFGLLIGFLAPLAWPHLHPYFPPIDFPKTGVTVASIKLFCLLAGCLIGSYFWGREFWGDQFTWSSLLFGNQLQWNCHGKNYVAMLFLAWAFLGWRTVLILYVSEFAIGYASRMICRWFNGIPKSLASVSFLSATMLLLVFWKPLSELFPW